MDILIYFGIALIAVRFGWWLHEVWMMHLLVRHPEIFKTAIDVVERVQVITADAIEVEAETVGPVVYAYNKQTGQFLAQGKDLVQAIAEAAKRYPGKRFWHPELKQDSQTA
jgi:hypothetical protein